MRGAVVYHSKYGNNKKVAESILDGLRQAGHEVVLVDAKAGGEVPDDVEFLVVGSPTRAGKMSSPIRKFIKKRISGSKWEMFPFAAFGTCRKDTYEKGHGSSAKDIKLALEKQGLNPMDDEFEAAVAGFKGPLAEEVEERALDFGKELGALLREDSE